MLNSIILSYITFIYFFCFLFYLFKMTLGKDVFGKIGSYLAMAGVLGHTLGIVLRWIESYKLGIGHAPLSNLYEDSLLKPSCFAAWRTRIGLKEAASSKISLVEPITSVSLPPITLRACVGPSRNRGRGFWANFNGVTVFFPETYLMAL